jgi:hypothetical protein
MVVFLNALSTAELRLEGVQVEEETFFEREWEEGVDVFSNVREKRPFGFMFWDGRVDSEISLVLKGLA